MNQNRQNNRFCGQPCVTSCAQPCGVSPAGRPIGVVGCASGIPAGNNSCPTGVQTGNIGVIITENDCNPETMISGMPIAMAYVPWQRYGDIYSLQRALERGTMFRELDLDFAGRRCN